MEPCHDPSYCRQSRRSFLAVFSNPFLDTLLG